ncbi:acetyl-CoA C-acyltransferase [Parahaliea mediterranea]|uniref:acetyl-CoA C-acyltransferase n=1 Tax=Parahaliea mediterranea TaxID=651086 RepID=A0A939DFW6_9GAMM|nr:acetyl-CoA C-acyltransferase [Parahaliea mediterranea]MBN7797513.1 acetyl-CoA C-acyltransferase [Parahaliea mediterranea]
MTIELEQAFIIDGARSAFGRHGGALSGVRPDDLLASVIRSLVNRNNVDPATIEDVVIGCTNQAGEDCRNVARFAALLADLPISTAGITLNRLCGSGLSAIADAARCIQVGDGQLYLAGGVEVMSRAPLVLSKADKAFSRLQTIADSTMGARFSNPAFLAQFGDDSMPQTADNVAASLRISRAECDRFAVASQHKYETARSSGFFTDEIVPVELPAGGRKPAAQVVEDEHPRPATDFERIAQMGALNEGGVVTAANASGINDGAAALLLCSGDALRQYSLTARGRILASAVAGVEPRLMGLGPVPAAEKALKRAGLTLDDMDVIEINEAFAAQALGCMKKLEIDPADHRVNPNGGAIAVGHPLGASGARIALTALRQLERTGGRYALASMCIGIGQGIALIIERV